MSLIPLNIPAGVYRNGTDFQSSGRWLDSNLIRWRNNTMQPIGGWRSRMSGVGGITRGMLAWTDNAQDRWLAVGTKNKMYVYSGSNQKYDITPTAGLAIGYDDASTNIGFSGGFYGYEEYGIARQDVQNLTPVTTWALDEWGEYLIACASTDGKLYEWNVSTSTPMAQIANSPIDNLSTIVTAERFIFALGADGNPQNVKWCDREDNTVWTASATNEAGEIELQTSGQIQCGLRVQGQTLIVTTEDAHAATYIGPPYVYGFERVGTSCGVIAKKAAAVTDKGAFWMGRSGFYHYAGGAVNEIPCDVGDYVFRDINSGQRSKAYAVVNSKFSEVWWFYPSAASTENDSYVTYNFSDNIWAIGKIARTAGVDSGAFKQPMWYEPSDDEVYEHEIGYSYGHGEEALMPFAISGPISLGNGDNMLSVTQMIPDELTQGDVQVTFSTRFHPNDVEREYGPYTMANPTSMRFTGRQIRMRVDGVSNSDWRVGINRIEAEAGGRR